MVGSLGNRTSQQNVLKKRGLEGRSHPSEEFGGVVRDARYATKMGRSILYRDIHENYDDQIRGKNENLCFLACLGSPWASKIEKNI